MDYVPSRITLTRKTGFTEEAARLLGELAQSTGIDPREYASLLLVEAIERQSETGGTWTKPEVTP